MLPLRDRNPTRRRPYVTWAIIAVCVAVYFFVQERPGATDIVAVEGVGAVQIDREIRFTLEYAAVPCEITQGRPLTVREVAETFGQDEREACDATASGPRLFPDKQVWLAVLTSTFLHGSLLHLGGNMLYLWIFGNNIEDHLGHVAYAFFYLVSGIVAALAHIAAQPDSTLPVVGASGAIAGVMGAYLVWFPRAPVTTVLLIIIPIITVVDAVWLLGIWFVSQFFTAPDSAVAWVAHVAGFVFGAFVGLIVRISHPARKVVWRGTGGRW
ncbi:MAG TPA: rhomboid family intramembrane serine protease [Acidimicrobiales bacterium]